MEVLLFLVVVLVVLVVVVVEFVEVDVCVPLGQLHVKIVCTTFKDFAVKLVLPLAEGLDGWNASYFSDVTQILTFCFSTSLYGSNFSVFFVRNNLRQVIHSFPN